MNAIVTGGSRGLGLAIVENFLREDYAVAFCARNIGEKEVTRLETPLYDLARMARAVDVQDDEKITTFIRDAIYELEGLDVLVCNAGIYGPMGPTESVSLGEWWETLAINLGGTLSACRAVIPHFKAQGHGKIIIISGGGATSPMPNISAYAASKAAVVRLMECLAEELRPWHIDVNAVAPGMMATRMVEQAVKAGPEAIGADFHAKNVECLKNGGTPLFLAAALVDYLASPRSNGITGKLISAVWDNWSELHEHRDELTASDIYCLRRITPKDRGKNWGEK